MKIREDVLEYILQGLIILVACVMLLIGCSIASMAKGQLVTYHEAGYNMTVYCLMNADIHVKNEAIKEERKKNHEAKKRAKELAEEKTLNEVYVSLFGYVPTKSEIYFLKRVVMAECGNTEPEDGIVAVILCIANRVRSDRFPNTINGVLMQQNQFETVSTRRYLRWPVNERVESAWGRVLDGRYDSSYRSILFFTAGRYNAYCIPMYRIGNHYFGR